MGQSVSQAFASQIKVRKYKVDKSSASKIVVFFMFILITPIFLFIMSLFILFFFFSFSEAVDSRFDSLEARIPVMEKIAEFEVRLADCEAF
jgi:flagellar basal body-associated protein FliL